MDNPLLSVDYVCDQLEHRLHALTKGRAAVDIGSLTDWIERKRIFLEGRLLDLHKRPWMRALYDDTHPHIVLRKAAQIGGSVWSMLNVLHKGDVVPDWRGTAYFFPTKGDVLDFSQTRVKPLIEENRDLKAMVGELDKAGARQFGSGFIFFRGMRSSVSLKSIPVDAVVFDELDEATERAKTMAKERLSGSAYKYVLELSNPTLPGYGIDLAFAGNADTGQRGSDERMWHVRCGKCREWVCLENEFPKSLGADDLRVLRPDKKHRDWKRQMMNGAAFEDMGWYRCCPKCDKPLDVFQGEWVPAKPSIKSPHGYALSQLFSPTVEPWDLAYQYATTQYPQTYYNMKIGIGWVPATDRLTVQHVTRWCTESPLFESHPGPCTMGVDQGKYLHVIISTPGPIEFTRQVVYLGMHRDWDELSGLIRRFNVRSMVGDALPETRAIRSLAQKHKGKVWLNYYVESQKGRPKWTRDDWTVQENRTESLDASRAPFHLDPGDEPSTNAPRVLLPRLMPEVEEFGKHMAALMKKREMVVKREEGREVETGEVRYGYVRSGPDHYAHAWNYDCLNWMPDMASVSRPSRGIVMATAGSGPQVPFTEISNPAHPAYHARPARRLLISRRK